MKNDDNTARNNQKRSSQPTADDHTKSDVDLMVQNACKKRGDTAVHIAVTNNEPTLLRDLLDRGLRVFNQSDADGATALHRAAEIGSQECAKILLEFNADIDALNFMGQTAFHVAAEKQDYEFGKYLIKFRARKNCRSGCKKCRFFMKQIEKYDKNKREQEEQEKQAKLEESKVQKQDKQDRQLVDDINQLNLLDEIEKCRKEMGGPYFNKKENQFLKEQQAKYRQEESIKTQRVPRQQEDVPEHFVPVVSLEMPVVVEQIRPRKQQQNVNQRLLKKNASFSETPKSQRSHQYYPQKQSHNREVIRSQQKDQSSQSINSNNQYKESESLIQRQAETYDQLHNQPPNSQQQVPQQLQRQIGKKQKRKKRIEEEEEEKKAGRSSLTQATNPDSDHY